MDDDSSAAQKKRGFGFRCAGADSLQVYLRISVVPVSCILKYLQQGLAEYLLPRAAPRY